MPESVSHILKNVEHTNHLGFNPFPGLRPFGFDETYMFFGREGQSDEILHKLSANRFVSVLGASGSGKSSLMYCGVIPLLYGGFITKPSHNWHIIAARPGSDPIVNLGKAIYNSLTNKRRISRDREFFKSLLITSLRDSPLGIVEAIKLLELPENSSYLLLIDQFEELFRFENESDESENESAIFIKLLVEAVNQSELPIYVVTTMRSDFIGECSHFPLLTEKINNSHYLIPQMKRGNMREAILGPVAVGGARITDRLVQELLNNVENKPDQLPALQHVLMRTWEYWVKTKNNKEPLDIKHYEAVGGISKALSQHADEAFDELTNDEKILCEHIFRTITRKGTDNRGVRNPTTIKRLVEITNSSKQEIITIVNRFRQTGRSFLTPAINVELTELSVIDISHESLMRVWDRLYGWVDEEASSIVLYRRLCEGAKFYQEGKTDLWRPPDLQIALNWKEKQKPTLAWATQFDVTYERALEFLHTSNQAYEAEEQNKIRQQKKVLKRTKTFAMVLGAIAIVFMGLMFYTVIINIEIEKQNALINVQNQKEKEARAEAEKQEKIADKQRLQAEAAKEDANIQKIIAEQEREMADEARIRAEVSQSHAEEALATAEVLRAYAEEKVIEAKEALALAEENAKRAIESESLAKKKSKETERFRMQAIAQSMAVKSTQVNRDADKKGAMALQAYTINQKHDGRAFHADIYDGLYYALKDLKEEDYNTIQGHQNTVRALFFIGESLYSSGSDGQVHYWKNQQDIQNNNFSVLLDLPHVIKNLVVSQDKSKLAVIDSRGNIVFVDVKSKLQQTINNHLKEPIGMYFNRKGDFYTVARDSLLIKRSAVDDYNSSYAVAKLPFEPKKLMFDQVTGKLLVLSNKNELYIADEDYTGVVALGKLIDEPIESFTVTADKKTLAIGDRIGNITLFDLPNQEVKLVLEGQNARVKMITFNTDNSLIAACSFDNTVQVWNMKNLNEQPLILRDHDSWVWSVAFSENGEQLLSGCQSGTIRVWPTSNLQMAQQICDLIDRNLSKIEWDRYVGDDIPYVKTCDELPIGVGVK